MQDIEKLISEVRYWNNKWQKHSKNPDKHKQPPSIDNFIKDLNTRYSVKILVP